MVKVLLALLFIAIGVFIGYYLGSLQKKVSFNKVELRKYSEDSLENMMDATKAVLIEREPSKYDSLKKIASVRDSLLDARGRISSCMIGFVKQPQTYKQLDSLRYSIDVLVDSCDNTIMQGSLDLLKTTNTGFRSLIKEIKDKTEQLKNVSKTVATIADVVSAITIILATPILAPVNVAATPSGNKN